MLDLHPGLGGEQLIQLRLEESASWSLPPTPDGAGSTEPLSAHSSPMHTETGVVLCSVLAGVSAGAAFGAASGAAFGAVSGAASEGSDSIQLAVAMQLSSLKRGQRQASRERHANRLKVRLSTHTTTFPRI